MKVVRQRSIDDQNRTFAEKIETLKREEEKRANPGRSEKRSLDKFAGKEVIVHLVPYSRTDVGFKKSVAEYYSGTN